jgi:hypothetical protein
MCIFYFSHHLMLNLMCVNKIIIIIIIITIKII